MPIADRTYPNTVRWSTIYIASALLFLIGVASFYKPGYGFTRLICIGGVFSQKTFEGLGCYVYPETSGYDGQFYAKMALDPLLKKLPYEPAETDGMAYRGRRILLSWTAWCLGLGKPAWIVQAYALQNVACWIALAWLLLRWFPPTDGENYVRWAGIVFSVGAAISVRCSMTDLPSTLLMILALIAFEKNRNGAAALLLAMATLARETSVLAVCSFADPTRRNRKSLGSAALLGLMTVAPLICWLLYLRTCLPSMNGSGGVDNFTIPFSGIAMRTWFLVSSLDAGHMKFLLRTLVLIGMVFQAGYLLARPQWSNPWWRMGAVFALLMLVLPAASFEPYVGPRILFPMTIAFNMLVPRGRGSWVPLLLANLPNLFTLHVFLGDR